MASKNNPPRLGRGLAALLGDAAGGRDEDRRVVVANVPVDQIDSNPFQPRMDFDPQELESLSESIKVQGVLQPILVRRHPTEADRYQIIAGERRFRAAGMAGLTEIPTLLRDMDDSDAAVVALVENLQRQDLNPLEEAEGYHRLMEEFGLTQEALGYAVSKSRSHIGNTVRLLRLPLVAKAVAARGVPRPPKPERLDIQDMEKRATEQVGCRVSISVNRMGGGELSVQFKDSRQLEDLIDRLSRRREMAETTETAE
jgi:ParB family chromosome partitioning protein